MTARLVESGRDEWQVFDDNDISYLNYVGTVRQFGDTWRAYGTRYNLDWVPVRHESPDFATQDVAVDWLLDGIEATA